MYKKYFKYHIDMTGNEMFGNKSGHFNQDYVKNTKRSHELSKSLILIVCYKLISADIIFPPLISE